MAFSSATSQWLVALQRESFPQVSPAFTTFQELQTPVVAPCSCGSQVDTSFSPNAQSTALVQALPAAPGVAQTPQPVSSILQ